MTSSSQPLRDELARLSREREGIELEVESASSRLRAAGVGMDKPLVDSEGFPLPNLDLAAIRGDRHLVITRMNDHKALTNRIEEVVKRLLEEGAPLAAAAATDAAGTAAPAAAAPAAGAPAPARPSAAAATSAPLNRLLPFARVDGVAPSSPAEEAGMRRGDRVVSFGAVSVSASSSSSSSSSSAASGTAAPPPETPAPLTRLPGEVAAALASGGSIDVVVLRAGAGSAASGGAASSEPAAASDAAAVREVSLRLTPREGWGGRGALGCHLKPL